MKEEIKLPNCSECGGYRWVEEVDELMNATIKEIHELDCPIAASWRRVYGTNGTN